MKQLPEKCMFFGYGSLMFAAGLRDRGMKHIYTDEELLPVTAYGLERSMSAEWVINPRMVHRYYGICVKADAEVFGVLLRIHSKADLIALLDDEYAAPVIMEYEPVYTLWDISDCFGPLHTGDTPKLALLCKPRKDNPELYAPDYVEYVYEHLPDRWKADFLLTGGKKP